MREALLYKNLNSKVRCNLCERRCIIPESKVGFCGTRKNIDGKLYTLIYGNISAMESRPIEIKPFFHFWPGSSAYTYSSWSCNLDCIWCQNYYLSKKYQEMGEFIKPEEIVKRAIKEKNQGICVSFNEPTLLHEYNIDCFKIAKENGLYNCYVSNGYFTKEALKMLHDSGLDAINIDIKGNDYVYRKFCKGINSRIVWRRVRDSITLGIHVEVINLIVTNVNDDEESIREVIENHLRYANENVPLHFTRYFPAYKFKEKPTDVSILENAYEMAKESGVPYVYIGNLPGSRYEDTYCPNCNSLLIKRFNYRILRYKITEDKRCPNCNTEIPIVGNYIGN
ncbi:MAG: AmmeMemoRadiSam system radical SAM enzyme [Candidatus Altiarchaeales archaeon]|nr:MAG: AmmeMemoRadiSam system radical SAM enzyme [Candidatus Altiarchaeales archaeon]